MSALTLFAETQTTSVEMGAFHLPENGSLLHSGGSWQLQGGHSPPEPKGNQMWLQWLLVGENVQFVEMELVGEHVRASDDRCGLGWS